MSLVQEPVKVQTTAEPAGSELTLRAILSGLVVGSLIGASNVCIGLKIGWTFGASITAAVISFALFRGLSPLLRRPYGAKENLITATAGSAAGTMASAGGFVACIPALELYRQQAMGPGHNLTYGQLVIWAISVAFLGEFFAVPLRTKWWCARNCVIPPAPPPPRPSKPCTRREWRR